MEMIGENGIGRGMMMNDKEENQNDLEAIDITVLASDYVKEVAPHGRDGLVTDMQGNVLGEIRPVIFGSSEGGVPFVWAFRPKDER
jgi:hypothetical protein